MSRDLDLAQRGALVYLPADLVTDEVLAELDEWSEIGFELLDCGCLWRSADVDDLDGDDGVGHACEATPIARH